MATTDVFNWPIPELGEAPNGPTGIQDLAEAIEATYGSTAYQTYTPTLVAGGVAFSNSNGTNLGRYRIWQGWCDLVVFMRFGSAVNGGTGELRITLPVPTASSTSITEQWILCRLWTPSHGHWLGQVYCPPSSNQGYPYVPRGMSNTVNSILQNANSSGSVGTGYPVTPGNKTIQVNGVFAVNGRYRVA